MKFIISYMSGGMEIIDATDLRSAYKTAKGNKNGDIAAVYNPMETLEGEALYRESLARELDMIKFSISGTKHHSVEVPDKDRKSFIEYYAETRSVQPSGSAITEHNTQYFYID